ncbi:MAG: glucose 1-dehydrogenase [Chloroflexota bacterium]
MDRVKGKVAIVTGAASGLGRATATLLAQEGARVILTDINQAGGQEAAAEIKSRGGEAVFVKHDVTSESSWTSLMEKVLADHGRLDVAVNNAGVMIVKEVENMTLEEWRRLMSVNLDGVFLGTKHAINAMRKGGGGSIVNISSAVGLIGTFDNTSAYIASKGGVRLFTKAAALECSKAGRDYNIRVNSVHPGIIETPLTAAMLEDPQLRKNMEINYPIGFPGQPIDVAYGVLYLASDESRFATGSELVIDGGWTAK